MEKGPEMNSTVHHVRLRKGNQLTNCVNDLRINPKNARWKVKLK